MRVVHIDVHVRPERLDEFLAETRRNAAASLTEPGVLRFDVVQDRADPGHLVFVEVYRDEDAPAAHKETAHYQRWRDAVADMMAVPRTPTTFDAVAPAEAAGWVHP